MNYMTNVKNVTKLSKQELYNPGKSSWHDQYRDSAWIFIGGFPYDLTEGDIICIFSQYGEVVNINLIREKETGKSKGFCFLCYEDQRSTILAVDNLNGTKILNRTIRVDHVQNYKMPKETKKITEETKKLYSEGCAPKPIVPVMPKKELQNEYVRETLADQIEGEIRLPARLPIYTHVKEEKLSDADTESKPEKAKKHKKNKHKKRSKRSSNDDSDLSDSEVEKNKSKKRREEPESRHEKNTDNHRQVFGSHQEYVASKKKEKRRDHLPSEEKEVKVYKRDITANIPQRWK